MTNTVIFWTNEQAKGNNHYRRNMPNVVATGRDGGIFNTGRYITQPSAIPHNKLLVSLTNAMGIEGDTFGDPKYGTGPITGLT